MTKPKTGQKIGEGMPSPTLNREAWLYACIDKLRPLFEIAGYPIVNDVRVSCGFPSRGGLSAKARKIGQCWSPDASEAGVSEIFISPTISDSVEVAAVLVHELDHAVVGTKCQHKGAFVKCMKAVGLVGKPTTSEVGPELRVKLEGIVAEIGPYPHARLDGLTTGVKKQTTRLLKAACPVHDYTVRVTQKWIDSMGYPLCPCGETMTGDAGEGGEGE